MKIPLTVASCLLFSACAQVAPTHLTRPADPSVRVPGLVIRDAAAGTRSYRPAEPADWITTNRGVAPAVPGARP